MIGSHRGLYDSMEYYPDDTGKRYISITTDANTPFFTTYAVVHEPNYCVVRVRVVDLTEFDSDRNLSHLYTGCL